MATTSNNEITFRQYRPTDKGDCLRVFKSNVGKFFAIKERKMYQVFLNNLPGSYFVLTRAKQLIGCGGYAPDRKEPSMAVLCWGMVHQADHGSGYGRILTTARIEQIQREAYYDSVCLRTSQHACGFYENMGFRITEVRKNAIDDGIDECLMLLDLRSA